MDNLFFKNKTEKSFDVIIHIFVLSLVLQIAYKYMLYKQERNEILNIIKKSLEPIINKSLDSIDNIDIKKEIIQILKYNFKDNNKLESVNDLIFKRNRIVIIFIFLIIVIFFIIMKYSCKSTNMNNIYHIIINNLLLFIFIGIIEGIIIYFIILKYVPFMPSKINTLIKKNIDNLNNDDEKCNFFKSCPPNFSLFFRIILLGIGLILLTISIIFFPYNNISNNKISLSLILWQSLFISILISFLFFTIGIKQENLVFENTINNVFDNTVKKIYGSLNIYDSYNNTNYAKQFINLLKNINFNTNTNDDKITKQKNNKLIIKLIIIISIILCLTILFHFIERNYYISKNNKYRIRLTNKILSLNINNNINEIYDIIKEFNPLEKDKKKIHKYIIDNNLNNNSKLDNNFILFLNKWVKQQFKHKQNINTIKIIIFNIIITLCCSFISEINFMINVVSQTETVSTNDIIEISLDILDN